MNDTNTRYIRKGYEMKSGSPKVVGTNIGGTSKGPSINVKGDWKPDSFGKKNTKAPSTAKKV